MVVIRDYQVGGIPKWLNRGLVHGHYMVLKPVQDIVEAIAPFFAVAENAAGQLEVIPRIYEKRKVEFTFDFLEILYEEAFHDKYRCGLQDNFLGNSCGIVENILRAGHGLAILDLPYVLYELLVVDGGGEVEILDSFRVGFLVFDGLVVVILVDHAKFASREPPCEFGDEPGFSRAAAARDSDGKVYGGHTAQT